MKNQRKSWKIARKSGKSEENRRYISGNSRKIGWKTGEQWRKSAENPGKRWTIVDIGEIGGKTEKIGGQRVENVWKIGGKSVQNRATLSFNLLCLCKRDGDPVCCRTLTGPYYEEITKLKDKRLTVHVGDRSQYYRT